MIIFRVARSLYPANDGLGARLYGGRWNHIGTALIYASQSMALCALEVLTKSLDVSTGLISIEIEVPDDLPFKTVQLSELPSGWEAIEPSHLTKDIGMAWVQGGETAILSGPSSIIPRERNYLLNPVHKDFARIEFHPPEPFRLDPRLK